MSTHRKRATIYLDPDLRRALRLKAAETGRSVSDLVNEAVGLSIGEDDEDIATFASRAGDREVPFDAVVEDLKRRGTL